MIYLKAIAFGLVFCVCASAKPFNSLLINYPDYLLHIQVKSDIDYLFVLVNQIWTTVVTLGTGSRAIIGPLPYSVVVVGVELGKAFVCVQLVILNASLILQCLIIIDFR